MVLVTEGVAPGLLAFEMNAAIVLPVVGGFTANTIPPAQCPDCAQKNQRGVVTWTVAM